MEELSDDILIEILSRVPATTLARAKWTNKRWHALISRPSFVKLHLERSRANPRSAASRKILRINSGYGWRPWGGMRPKCIDSEYLNGKSIDDAMTPIHDPTSLWSRKEITSVDIRGSCDGLICLCLAFESRVHQVIYLWNPCNGEFMELPDVPVRIPKRSAVKIGVGLGYDCEADDYKVVIAYWNNDTDDPENGTVHIFSRKTCTWKRVVIPDAPKVTRFSVESVNLNSVVHWLVQTGARTSKCIFSFDLAKEKFRELPIPEVYYQKHVGIGVLDGCLCLCTLYCWLGTGIYVSIMKEYGVKASWARLQLNIRFETITGVRLQADSVGEISAVIIGKILVIKGWRPDHFVLLYNVKKKSFRVWTDGGNRKRVAHVYEETLVSPYLGVRTSQRKRRLHPRDRAEILIADQS